MLATWKFGLDTKKRYEPNNWAAARSLSLPDFVGTIDPRMLADVVLLEGDPLQSIRHTQAIRAVVVNGRYFDRGALKESLVDAEAAAQR